MGRVHTKGRGHPPQVELTGALRRVLAHIKLRAKG